MLIPRTKLALLCESFPITINFDGDAQKFFIGGWSEVGGNVLNDKIVVGATLWDAAAAIFTSGTYAWAAQGGNTLANVSNELEITYVDNPAGALDFFKAASDLTSDLTVGVWYMFSMDNKVNLGTVSARVYDGANNLAVGPVINYTSMQQINFTLNARSTVNAYARFGDMGAGEKAYVDNLSLKPITLTSLFNVLKSQFGLSDGFFIDVYINAVTAGNQVGAIWNYDGSNNFGMAYMDGTSLIVEKNVNGTYTGLASVAQAVTSDQILRIENPAGSNVLDILYNGVSKATPTIADASVIENKGIALFSTEANNAISKVVIGRL